MKLTGRGLGGPSSIEPSVIAAIRSSPAVAAAVTARHRCGPAAVLGAGVGVGVAVTLAGPALAESDDGVRVMPLGDSITDGFNVPGGYRINLLQALAAAGRRTDFVGSGVNGPGELRDHDHEGHSGWRIDELDANIGRWLAATAPRTVLPHIGTNDMGQNYDVANAPACTPTAPGTTGWRQCG